MTLIRDPEDQDHGEPESEEIDLAAPETRAAGRWNSAGVPGERSKDFKNAVRRMIQMLGPMRFVLGIVLVVAVTSATLNVFGPRVLGHGTDLIIKGFTQHHMDFGALHHVLLQAVALYAASSL